MTDLAALFESTRCSEVETYIQSGTVLFGATAASVKTLPRRLTNAIAEVFGYDVPIVLRTAAELERVAGANPFLPAQRDVTKLCVAFLADSPSLKAINALDPDRSPPDAFAVRGKEIYLDCPNGLARTKLTNAYFEAKLSTTSTMRNWKTVLKLAELATASR